MERREFPRRIITWRARLCFETAPHVQVEGRLGDISRGGLSFISDMLFKERTQVILLTQAPPKDIKHPGPVIEIHGTVAHCYHANMHFQTGVKIGKITQGAAAFKEWCPE